MLVQTFQPDARPIVYAARHDVARFLTEELERRKELGYPPFCHLVRIVVAGPEPEPVIRALDELKAGIPGADLLGPAALLRLRGQYRAQLVAKTRSRAARVASRARSWPPRPRHAPGGADRGRRRRSAVALTDMPHPDGQAHYPVAATG